MGKDRFGNKRGKCSLCEECYEYMPPADGATLACEYCDHKPIYHEEVLKLGACTCGKCFEYISGQECQYTMCNYCDCSAEKHTGYEKVQLGVEKAKQRLSQYGLKDYQSQPMQSQFIPAYMHTQGAMHSMPFLRHSNQTQALPGIDQSEQQLQPRNYATQVFKLSFVGCVGVIIAINVIYGILST